MLAEEAGNAVFLSASAKIDEVLKELEVFEVDEPISPEVPENLNTTEVEINEDELPF